MKTFLSKALSTNLPGKKGTTAWSRFEGKEASILEVEGTQTRNQQRGGSDGHRGALTFTVS